MNIKNLPFLFLLISLCYSCKKPANDPQPAVVVEVPVHETPVQVSPPKTIPTIVILGSSTAQGFGASRTDSCWASKLQLSVNKGGQKANFINLAYGGYTTYDILPSGTAASGKPVPDTARNITKALFYKPSLVLISLPSNDVAASYTNREILNNYLKLSNLLDAAHIPYLILSCQPRDFQTNTQRLQLKTLNDMLRNVYSDRFDDFFMQLSTSSYFIKPEYEFGDGVHLNNGGHNVIFKSLSTNTLLGNIIK